MLDRNATYVLTEYLKNNTQVKEEIMLILRQLTIEREKGERFQVSENLNSSSNPNCNLRSQPPKVSGSKVKNRLHLKCLP